MTTLAAPGGSAAASSEAPARIGAILRETFGFLGTFLRLLWRHWPALLALAVAAQILRQLLIDVTVEAARWRDGLGGELMVPLVPAVMLISMVLMLRIMRPSLPYLGPLGKSESMLRYLGSVTIPFLAFYFAAGYAVYDHQSYGYSVMATSIFGAPDGENVPTMARPQVLLGLAIGAFLLRGLVNLVGARRRPWLALPALYPEILWMYMALFVTNLYIGPYLDQLKLTRIYQWLLTVTGDAPGVLSTWSRALLEDSAAVLVVPITALVAGAVVLAVQDSRPATAAVTGWRRWLQIGRVAGRPLAGTQFGLIGDALRRVFQAGVAATMVFCLAYLCVQSGPAYLAELQRLIIGPREPDRVWAVIEFPLMWLNDAIGIVLVAALIAAFVDRTAARRARVSRQAPAPAPVPIPPPAGDAVLSYPVTPTYVDSDQTVRVPAPGSLDPTQRVPPPYPTAPQYQPAPYQPGPYQPGPHQPGPYPQQPFGQ